MTPERQNMTKPEAVTQEDADEATDFATRYLYPNCQGVRSALAQAFARHRIAAEQRGAERERERCIKAIEDDAQLCDCFAHSESECACGAWCEWKSITSARAVEIICKGEQA